VRNLLLHRKLRRRRSGDLVCHSCLEDDAHVFRAEPHLQARADADHSQSRRSLARQCKSASKIAPPLLGRSTAWRVHRHRDPRPINSRAWRARTSDAWRA